VFHFGPSVTAMSTVTSDRPRRGGTRSGAFGAADTEPHGQQRRIVSGQLALVFLAEFCALTSFYLLLGGAPRLAVAAGASSAGAGLVNGVLLLGTVAAELVAPLLLRRGRYLILLVIGSLLFGAPVLALLPGATLASIVTVSAFRGVGFGLTTVMTGTLTAELLPPERRGEGLGLFGVVATAPGIIALPAGVWLAAHFGMALVVGLGAATALVPVAAFPWLRDRPGRHMMAAIPRHAQRSGGLVASLRQHGQLRPFVIFAATTVAAGVVVSFLPLATGVAGNVAAAGLLVQALTATISRWLAGRYGDRSGHARQLVPALAIAAAGMIAMIWLASPLAVIAGMFLFGAGFGISQNATLAVMIDRAPPAGLGTASALWNLAYDAGYGAGPAVFGLFAGRTGYPAAFAVTGVLMLVALPVARRESSAVPSSALAGQMSSRADVEMRASAPTTRCEAKSASLSKGVR
jgi:MFS family permease